MKTTFSRATLWLIVTLFLVNVAAAQTYTYEQVGTLGGNYNFMVDLNDNRVAVGASRDSSNQQRPALWFDGQMTDLGILPGRTPSDYGMAESINNSNQVIGSWSRSVNGSVSDAFYWNPNTQTLISITPPGWVRSHPIKILDDGRALCGGSPDGYGIYHYIYNVNTGVFTHLGSVSGAGYTSWNGAGHMASRDGVVDVIGGSSYNIGIQGYENVTRRVNSLGAMIGSWRNLSTGRTYGFLWRPFTPNGTVGKWQAVPSITANPKGTNVEGLNCWGWTIGMELPQTGSNFAVLWREGSAPIDLNTVKPSGVTWELRVGKAINTRGDLLVHTNNWNAQSAILYVNP